MNIIQQVEYGVVECTMSYLYYNWYNQENFTWKEIRQTSIHYSSLLAWPFSELFFFDVSL